MSGEQIDHHARKFLIVDHNIVASKRGDQDADMKVIYEKMGGKKVRDGILLALAQLLALVIQQKSTHKEPGLPVPFYGFGTRSRHFVKKCQLDAFELGILTFFEEESLLCLPHPECFNKADSWGLPHSLDLGVMEFLDPVLCAFVGLLLSREKEMQCDLKKPLDECRHFWDRSLGIGKATQSNCCIVDYQKRLTARNAAHKAAMASVEVRAKILAARATKSDGEGRDQSQNLGWSQCNVSGMEEKKAWAAKTAAGL